MGKWMASYRDELLHNKLADILGGAVKRSCLEPDEQPSINLDALVEDLDPGDSFVTTIMDILVNELADRRTRKEDDRRRISDRTSRTLRQLGTSLRVHRASSSRRLGLSDFLEPPPDELDLDDEDLETYDSTSFTALSDAFVRDSSAPSFVQPLSRSLPSMPAEGSQLMPVSVPMSSLATRALPPLRSNSRRTPRVAESSSSLTRQNSLRRTGRARTTDFHDFTSRRRSAARDGADDHSEASGTRHLWSLHHDGGSGADYPSPSQGQTQASMSRAPSYPFRRHEIGGLFPLETVDPSAPFQSLTDARNHPRSVSDVPAPGEPILPPFSWFGPEDDIPRMLNNEDALPRFFSEPEDLRSFTPPPIPLPMPRLRRGGIRAPEVMATEQVHAYLAAERGD